MVSATRKAGRAKIVMGNQTFVLVPEKEYERLVEGNPPPLPPKNSRGNFPAIAATDALIAKGLVRDRKAAGLTQRELARRAGIRVETLNRAERGAVVPDVRTLRKVEKALNTLRRER